MNFVIIAVEALDVICDLVLKATHHDKTPEEIEKIIYEIRGQCQPCIPPPKATNL